ncbi:MAG TPA: hypothetical protein VGC66_06495 [Pyrinomonadaceae bacterium]
MKRTKIVILLLGLLIFQSFVTGAFAQEATKAKESAGAKKVTITLVRWPYT